MGHTAVISQDVFQSTPVGKPVGKTRLRGDKLVNGDQDGQVGTLKEETSKGWR